MSTVFSEAEVVAELLALEGIQVESMGWQPLEQGAYLHEGDPNATIIEVVGIPQLDMANSSVLWLV